MINWFVCIFIKVHFINMYFYQEIIHFNVIGLSYFTFNLSFQNFLQ